LSDIRANTISDAAGTGPIALTGQSAAKAWVNFNGTGTIAIRDSVNVGSVVDNGTGIYTVNFTNSMANSSYSSTGTGGGTSGIPNLKIPPTVGPYSVSAFQFQSLNTATSATMDTAILGTQNFGDLA